MLVRGEGLVEHLGRVRVRVRVRVRDRVTVTVRVRVRVRARARVRVRVTGWRLVQDARLQRRAGLAA